MNFKIHYFSFERMAAGLAKFSSHGVVPSKIEEERMCLCEQPCSCPITYVVDLAPARPAPRSLS